MVLDIIKNVAVVGAGSFIGGAARYLVSLLMKGIGKGFPWATLSVNLVGCFLIGLLWGLFSRTASGRNAMDWIHENTAKIIARELKYTDKTIQEICNELDFVGLQSFGKLCRQNLGLAPREFRNKYRS